jgi:hypothetical protein
MTYEQLCQLWIQAKEDERKAVENRRQYEDELLSLIGVAENFEGIENAEAPGGYKIKITGRINRKVDADALQELAAEAGLTGHLSSLFRWKPEIDAKAWKAADVSITGPLMGAITTTPSRASFAITKE